jgi:integrase/recombinase XerD
MASVDRLFGLMEEHFGWLLVNGYSPDTVRTRRIAIRRFLHWLYTQGIADPREVRRSTLVDYQRALFVHRKRNGQPMALSSQIGCLAPLKTWFKWLSRERHIGRDPALAMRLPKLPRRLPRALLSVREVESILAQPDPSTPAGLRDRAMLELLYSTGLRRMEIARLAPQDVDLVRRIVFVREGKGRRDRVVPLGERACDWMRRYTEAACAPLPADPAAALFLTDQGNPVSREFVASRVKRYMHRAGVRKTGSAHLFRHACATHMLDNGADIRIIQALLGHARLETTELYTHVSIRKLCKVHAATHPTGRIRRTDTTAVADWKP